MNNSFPMGSDDHKHIDIAISLDIHVAHAQKRKTEKISSEREEIEF